MEKARELLKQFSSQRNAERISDDLAPLESTPKTSKQVTDLYLADLAAKHGLRLATLDGGNKHPAVEVLDDLLGKTPA